MRVNTLAVFAVGAIATASPVDAKLSEVVSFTVRRDKCDHFRGEDAYDAARSRFLAAQMRRYCQGTDRELKRLRVKYAKNRAVIERLANYDPGVE